MRRHGFLHVYWRGLHPIFENPSYVTHVYALKLRYDTEDNWTY